MSDPSLPAHQVDGETGRWLVLTHGAFGSSADFEGVVPRLVAQGWRVLRWDLPGHGGSTHLPPARRLEEAARALCRLMDALGIEHAAVLGTSFGGMVAQRFALDYPERCAALLACVCVPIIGTALPLPGLLMTLTRLGWALQPWPRWSISFAAQAASGEASQAALAAQVQAQSPTLREAIWKAMLHGCSNKSPDSDFRMPVGLLTADGDTRFPGAQAGYRRFAAQLPAGRHVELAGVGHLAYVEQPAVFAEGLLALLARMALRQTR